jgi:hypothetical protein
LSDSLRGENLDLSDLTATRSDLARTIESMLAEHVVERRWVQDRTGSTCVLLRGERSSRRQAVFLKVPRSASGEWAHRIWTTLTEFEQRARDLGMAPLAPGPIAWGVDPSFIAYEWIEGDTLAEQLGALVGRPVSLAEQRVVELGRTAGRALGELHRMFGVGRHTGASSALRRRQRAILAAAGASPADVGGAVRSFRDMGPWNMIVRPDGSVAFIDLDRSDVRSAAWEVGVLASQLARTCDVMYARAPASVGDAPRRIHDAVIDGYLENNQGAIGSRRAIAAFSVVNGVGLVMSAGRSLRRRGGAAFTDLIRSGRFAGVTLITARRHRAVAPSGQRADSRHRWS